MEPSASAYEAHSIYPKTPHFASHGLRLSQNRDKSKQNVTYAMESP